MVGIADSCWNGMITLDARPFRGISLAGEAVEPLLFRSGDAERGECTGSSFVPFSHNERWLTCPRILASECQIMAKDFWRRGFARFVVNPSFVPSSRQQIGRAHV